MKERCVFPVRPACVKVDNRGQRYLVYPDGQLRRIFQNGTSLPRVRLSKKERLKLRQEYVEVKNLKAEELVTKILKTPVVNPVAKSVSELENLPVEELKTETADA
jgi:hypothetical protein